QARKSVASEHNDRVAFELADGRSVIGISHLPQTLLPPVLLAGADIVIRINQPSGTTLRKVMQACLSGRIPLNIHSDIGAVLDFHDLVSAIRRSATPRETTDRLHAIAQARRRNTTAL